MDCKKMYEINEEFKRYVDKYCMQHMLTVDVALTHALVQEVAKFYAEGTSTMS